MKGSPMQRNYPNDIKAQPGDSPGKFNWDQAANMGIGIATGGALGAVLGAGGAAGDKSTNSEWQDILEEEDLDRNMWSGTIFGRRRDKERKRRLKELRAKKKLEKDREFIAENTGSMAGASTTATGLEEESEKQEVKKVTKEALKENLVDMATKTII